MAIWCPCRSAWCSSRSRPGSNQGGQPIGLLPRAGIMNLARQRAQTTDGIKRMWREERLQREPPLRPLTPEDLAVNQSFSLDDMENGRWDPVELLDRVRRGVKPMATLVLRRGRTIHLAERALRQAVGQLGLGLSVVRVTPELTLGVVFQGGLRLASFYEPDATLAAFARGGFPLPSRSVFFLPLECFARNVALEAFEPGEKYHMLGLSLGYPVEDTLAMLRGMQTAGGRAG